HPVSSFSCTLNLSFTLPYVSSTLTLFTPSPSLLFFFNHTATTEIYTLSLHDALPISCPWLAERHSGTSSPAPGREGGSRRLNAKPSLSVCFSRTSTNSRYCLPGGFSVGMAMRSANRAAIWSSRSEERRVGKECRSQWSTVR